MGWQAAAISAASAIGQSLMNRSSSAASASQSYGVNEGLMRQQFLYDWIASNLAEQQYYRTAKVNQDYALESMQRQYDLNLDLMNRSNAFQELMSNTAHQREMSDLKAAGLNPILAANSGAYSSFGSSASVQALSGSGTGFGFDNSGSGIGIHNEPVNFAEFGRLSNDNKRVKNETGLTKSQQKELETKSNYNSALEGQVYDNQKLAWEQFRADVQDRKEKNEISRTEARAQMKNAEANYVSAVASKEGAATGSARLAHEKLQYNESDAKAAYEFARRHPTYTGIMRGTNMFMQNFANVLPSVGWRFNVGNKR